jgi:hypothetical protein
LYGCENWSITVTARHTIIVHKKRVLTGTSGCKRRSNAPFIYWVIENIMKRVRHVAYMGERRDTYRILVGRAERKRPLERHRRRCADNIKN